jgi:hypothetical protein
MAVKVAVMMLFCSEKLFKPSSPVKMNELYHYLYTTQLFVFPSISSALILKTVFKHPTPQHSQFMFISHGYILY